MCSVPDHAVPVSAAYCIGTGGFLYYLPPPPMKERGEGGRLETGGEGGGGWALKGGGIRPERGKWVVVNKNMKIVLEGKVGCRRHGMAPTNPVMGGEFDHWPETLGSPRLYNVSYYAMSPLRLILSCFSLVTQATGSDRIYSRATTNTRATKTFPRPRPRPQLGSKLPPWSRPPPEHGHNRGYELGHCHEYAHGHGHDHDQKQGPEPYSSPMNVCKESFSLS
jgi:hypothetical protein